MAGVVPESFKKKEARNAELAKAAAAAEAEAAKVVYSVLIIFIFDFLRLQWLLTRPSTRRLRLTSRSTRL